MAEPLIQHTGIAAVIDVDNVDTDQIIPSREMKTVGRTGLGDGLFAGWRYTRPGGRALQPGFVLNRPEQAGTSILISGLNFGCGSSREHAVWALAEYGVRVIVARSFGEIFYSNCLRNGILPVILSEADIVSLMAKDQPLSVKVDVASQTLSLVENPDWTAQFELDAYPKRLLMEGLDPIALTLKDKAVIDQFQDQDRQDRPWVYDTSYSAA